MKYLIALITAPLWAPFVALIAAFTAFVTFVVYKMVIVGLFLTVVYFYFK